MKHQQLTADVITFTGAISALGETDQWPLALHLLEDMKSQEVLPNHVTYGAALNACEKLTRLNLLQVFLGSELATSGRVLWFDPPGFIGLPSLCSL